MEQYFFQGLAGHTYQLQEHPIAGGGEGEIYIIVNHPGQVAKIFKENRRTAQREEKLKKMVQIKLTDDQLQQVTWPQDVIYSQNGFAGYVMPVLKNNKNLNHIYAISGDKQDFRKRILIAYNLCEAVDVVHSLGQVCGDLNPQNICVDEKTGFVTLVDTDSFHFHDQQSNQTYRCEVGLSDYIAPEIQNKVKNGLDLRNAPLPTYTRETDLFALAVHIFALLMNGCHPFACAVAQDGKIENQMEQMTATPRESVVLPQPIDNIRQGFFPFHQKRERITYPLYAPEFDSLPDYLQALFVRTFETGFVEPAQRVTAKEWQEALKRFLENKDFSRCPEGHLYSSHRGLDCPWCAMTKRMIEAMSGGAEAGKGSGSGTGSGSGKSSGSGTGSSSGMTRKKGLLVSVASFLVVLIVLFLAVAVDNEHGSNHFAGLSNEGTETPFAGDPWELAQEMIECPNFGGTLQIPQGSSVEDEEESIYIYLHDSIGESIEISAKSALTYFGSDYNEYYAQSAYDAEPAEELKKYYQKQYDGDPYTLDGCEYKKLGDKCFTILQYHNENYTNINYLTSNKNVCYEISMSVTTYKPEYAVLLEKIAATVQFKRTYVTGDVLLEDGTRVCDKVDDLCDIYFKKKGEPTENDYDTSCWVHDDGFAKELAPGTYHVLVTHDIEDENGDYVVDYSYRSEIIVPETNNEERKIDIVVS